MKTEKNEPRNAAPNIGAVFSYCARFNIIKKVPRNYKFV